MSAYDERVENGARWNGDEWRWHMAPSARRPTIDVYPREPRPLPTDRMFQVVPFGFARALEPPLLVIPSPPEAVERLIAQRSPTPRRERPRVRYLKALGRAVAKAILRVTDGAESR